MKKFTYTVSGMHCASCEVLIEEKLIQLPRVEAVDASAAKGAITIYYQGNTLPVGKINEILKDDGYCLCDHCETEAGIENFESPSSSKELLTSVIIAVSVFLGFLLLNRLELFSLVNVSASSSLPTFFLFGLLAGVSTCAALTGGIVLSMSEKWQEGFAKDESLTEKMKPHLMFNIGRIASYTLFGAILGILGAQLQLSITFGAFLVIAVSVFMILNGLKMVGVKALRGFQLALPKSVTHRLVGRQNVSGKSAPTMMGALTILLPCGFTITAQSLALLSGNWLQGALILSVFALGTAPGLLAIGFSAVKMGASPRAAMFSKIAGALVLLFALFNINAQLNVLGLPSLNNYSVKAANDMNSKIQDGLAPLVAGKQLLKMDATSYEYSPNYFKVRAGVPVRWEIRDAGFGGCTNAVVSSGLFSGQIALEKGKTVVKEFTPKTAGKYKFSCWMGMVSGMIEVVDTNSNAPGIVNAAVEEIPSGAAGCGCGSGTGSCAGTR